MHDVTYVGSISSRMTIVIHQCTSHVTSGLHTPYNSQKRKALQSQEVIEREFQTPEVGGRHVMRRSNAAKPRRWHRWIGLPYDPTSEYLRLTFL